MTNEQMETLKGLKTIQERAKFLLSLGVSATTNMQGLDLVSQACVGEVRLPITGENDEDVINRGVEWLKEKSKG